MPVLPQALALPPVPLPHLLPLLLQDSVPLARSQALLLPWASVALAAALPWDSVLFRRSP
jgi:hypothetical protein